MTSSMTAGDVRLAGLVVSVLALLATIAIAVVQSNRAVAQLAAAKRAQQARTLLEFDRMLDRHVETHRKLRPGGEWFGENPVNQNDMPEIEYYLGLFERAQVLIDDDFLDHAHFKHLFGYRISNIMENDTIRNEKLIQRASGWKYFLELASSLGYEVEDFPRRMRG